MSFDLPDQSTLMAATLKDSRLNAGLTKRRDMLSTMKDLQPTFHDYCDEARSITSELAELVGEQYVLQDRLQWIENRQAELRLNLAKLRNKE